VALTTHKPNKKHISLSDALWKNNKNYFGHLDESVIKSLFEAYISVGIIKNIVTEGFANVNIKGIHLAPLIGSAINSFKDALPGVNKRIASNTELTISPKTKKPREE